jgi:hypothetical protein
MMVTHASFRSAVTLARVGSPRIDFNQKPRAERRRILAEEGSPERLIAAPKFIAEPPHASSFLPQTSVR